MIITRPFDMAAMFRLGPHRLGALYPLNGLNTMEVEWGAGNQGRERAGMIVGLMPFLTSRSEITDPTARLQ